MISSLRSTLELIKRTYALARPFGRRRLAGVAMISLIQGLFSVVGVTSIFPFLALASDPDRLRKSNIGSRVLDAIPEMDNTQLLIAAGIFAISMLLLSNAVSFIAMKSRMGYGTSFAHWMRLRIIRKILARPYRDFLQINSGIFFKKVMADVDRFATAILLPMLGLWTCMITIILLLAILIYVHPQIALAVGSVLGSIYVIIFWVLGSWRHKASKQLKEAQEGTYKETQQLLLGVKPVKVHCAEEAFINKVSTPSANMARIMMWTPIVGQAPRLAIEPFALGGVVLAVIYYVARGQELSIILPNLAVMALAAYRILPNIQAIYSSITSLGTARHALDEVYAEIQAIDKEKDLEEGTNEGEFRQPNRLVWSDSIRLENVSFQYPGSPKPIIEDLNLTIKRNTSLGIIGQTGSGKSTLVDLILGLHTGYGGEIHAGDAVLCPKNRRAWRAGIGYVPQDIYLLDDSLEANIAFGVDKKDIDHEAVVRAAKAAQIYSFIENELPKGFDTTVGERGVRLSGGQRQRVGLARALYHQPDLLILDEATSALDVETEAEVMKSIDALHGSITVIIIAHRLSTIEGCDEVLNLS